jgi:hypothetical protein
VRAARIIFGLLARARSRGGAPDDMNASLCGGFMSSGFFAVIPLHLRNVTLVS